jgi:signal transduction histidine kinase
MLARLRIRQKLNLLLVLPLVAVIITTIPIVIERVNAAGASVATAQAASEAREIGVLIQDLQQERLIALGFLSTGQIDAGTMLAQIEAVTDDNARVNASATVRADLGDTATAMANLDEVRTKVLNHRASVGDVYTTYSTAIDALLDALRLSDRPGVDVDGLGRLAALDALMRANEAASSIGAALVAVVADGSFTPQLAAAVATLDQQDQRFHRLGEQAQVDLVDEVEHGQAGVRLRRLADNPDSSDAPPGPPRAAAALTVAVSYTDLRLIAQDRVIRDIATAAQVRAGQAQGAALAVGVGGLLLFVLVVALSTIVSRSISSPLRRLARAAGQVADVADAELVRVGDSDEAEPAPPRLAAVEVGGQDEVGELAHAFNRVQSTAARMLERQVSSRHNVAVMFANIARRTQTLVGRQLMLIDELEQSEQNPDMMERLYRLDHVATRLRRSADALLVVSGTRDEAGDEAPVALTDVIRSAVAEIEGYCGVGLRSIAPVAVDIELVGDLRLLLAELLENATSFSPPATLVEVIAELDDVEDCVVSIVDLGIGMTALQMVEENRRLVERERLDVAPTTVLGLFVVGRLARRHGLSVRLVPTPGQGVTARVVVPRRLLHWSAVSAGQASLTGASTGPASHRQAPIEPPRRPLGALAAALSRPVGHFGWFSADGRRPAVELPAGPSVPTPSASPPSVPPLPAPTSPVPSQPSPATPVATPPLVVPGPPAEAQVGSVPDWPPQPAGGGPTPAGTQPRGGLTRRTPGQNLPSMAEVPPFTRYARDAPIPRDAEAERDELDDFMDGLTRARPTPPSTGEPR